MMILIHLNRMRLQLIILIDLKLLYSNVPILNDIVEPRLGNVLGSMNSDPLSSALLQDTNGPDTRKEEITDLL